jgi:hypothetical protein
LEVREVEKLVCFEEGGEEDVVVAVVEALEGVEVEVEAGFLAIVGAGYLEIDKQQEFIGFEVGGRMA